MTVDAGKIRFSVPPATEELSGRFVFSYLSAETIEVEVRQGVPEIHIDDASDAFSYTSGFGSFGYEIFNMREGFELNVKSTANWIKDIQNTGNSISYSVSENQQTLTYRTGRIILTYAGISTDYTVYQGSLNSYGSWIGNWTFTGANGIAQTVAILPGVPYSTYLMTGYGGLSEEFAVTLKWNGSQRWVINNQNLGKVVFSDGSTGVLWLAAVDTRNGFLDLSEDATVCTVNLADDGTFTVTPSNDNTVMRFIAKSGDSWHNVGGSDTDYPSFPFLVTASPNF